MDNAAMVNDFIRVLARLMDEDEIQVVVKSSVHSGLITGLSALAGGLLLGRMGVAIGGVIGGLSTAVAQANKFKPASSVINDLPRNKREELLNAFKAALKKHKYTIAGNIATFIVGNSFVRSLALNAACEFLRNDYTVMRR